MVTWTRSLMWIPNYRGAEAIILHILDDLHTYIHTATFGSGEEFSL
jgi:hypothetical protein